MKAHERILVALDTPNAGWARELVQELSGDVGGFKIGLELFTAHGPSIVREVRDAGSRVFLDLKMHDIPNTVAGGAAAAARLGVSFLTVHALGGPEMIRRGTDAAAEAAEKAGHRPPVILAVTVLTSHDEADLKTLGLAGPCQDAVVRLAAMASEARAGGIVCSALEVARVQQVFPAGIRVVPGIRPAFASRDDQARVATPASAIADGADRVVIGRPITRADDPVAAARAIAREIEQGEAE
jgi:orotidine-5'-phosphate decarboxylase